MGYSTEFHTKFKITPVVPEELVTFLNEFSNSRRMKRDVSKFTPEMLKRCYKGNPGIEGEYYAFDGGNFGQINDSTVLNFNEQPSTQPSLWCSWTVSEDGSELIWDGSEKTYKSVEWIQYLIDNFIAPCGSKINGLALCFGECTDDRWYIQIDDNKVKSGDLTSSIEDMFDKIPHKSSQCES